MTVRKFRVLLRGLPMSANTRAEWNGGWSVTDHLLADVVEAVWATRAAVIATVTTKPGKRLELDAPRYPRPGPKEQPKKSSWGGLVRSLMKGGE